MACYGGQQRLVEVASGTAIWYHNGLPPVPIRWVVLRDPLSPFSPQARLCTDQAISPTPIIEWFVLRWQVELTFHEVRTHLGVETQRQWSDLAILRTTPALLGLFSLIALFAQTLLDSKPLEVTSIRLVHQSSPHLRRYARVRSSTALARHPCLHVACQTRSGGNSTSTV